MLLRCAAVSRYYKGGITVAELLDGPPEQLYWLEGAIRAENDPRVEAWRKEKAATRDLHRGLRKGTRKVR